MIMAYRLNHYVGCLMNIKKLLTIPTIFFLLIIFVSHTTFAMQSAPLLQKTLAELTNALDQLHDKLEELSIKKAEKACALKEKEKLQEPIKGLGELETKLAAREKLLQEATIKRKQEKKKALQAYQEKTQKIQRQNKEKLEKEKAEADLKQKKQKENLEFIQKIEQQRREAKEKRKKEKETVKAEPRLPWELTEAIILDTIPDSIQDSKTFYQTIKDLTGIAKSNKVNFYETLKQDSTKQKIIQKLFKNIHYYHQINDKEAPLEISDDKSVLGTINNVLFYLNQIANQPFHQKASLRNAMNFILNAGINPNFFIKNMNLLAFAIHYNLPDIVDTLIINGADINLPSRIPSQSQYLNYEDATPFMYALSFSPQSALELLESSELTLDTNNIKLYKTKMDPLYFEIIKKMIERGIDPNTEISTIIKGETVKASLFGMLLSLYQKNESELETIDFLLKKGAKINKPFYNFFSRKKPQTPIKFVTTYKEIHPELYNLLEGYKNNPNNT